MGIFVGCSKKLSYLLWTTPVRPPAMLHESQPPTQSVRQSVGSSSVSQRRKSPFGGRRREEELDQQQHPGGVRGEVVGNPILLIAPI